ncbi:hypothetical protein EJB05_23558 [Eragrostis curvula]|uniref:DUF3615 domain-containing protein n=1 Tax=Eragrostis curvula TaxID=38414 RepID=A0A5J9V7E6_9POAL|nr:hypothetical protein EJB05_23558 [Eragrostis curvula]
MADQEPKSMLHNSDFSRFKLLSVDDLVPIEGATNHCDEEIVREGATATHEHGSHDASEDDEDIGDPFLVDEFGNLTKWKLSDLNKQFGKYLDDELNEPKTKEKKQSKQDKLKWHNDRMELYVKSSIMKYNKEENLDEGFCFQFVKVLKESFIVERGCKFYRHVNFEAMQSGTSISLFFAEVILDGENCEVTCCKLLKGDDNGRCLGCNNQGHPDLIHPASGNDDSVLREELTRPATQRPCGKELC